ncbi:MAG TPA: glycosyltransferase [Flavobacteriales bacterium]|nr:glycosyltransferase [Flavobacteriales bacterium]
MTTHLFIAFTLFAVALVYAIVLNAWRDRLRAADPPAVGRSSAAVSMIIPARDAASTIIPLLQDLHAQDLPKERIEVIVVDDHSTDGTDAVVKAMCARWPELRVLRNSGAGKKAAITTGVQAARYATILLTDADARVGPQRSRHVVEAMEGKGLDLMILPVRTSGTGVLGRLQQEEQAGLTGVALGAAMTGWPTLASGANLAFGRQAFLDLGGYEGDTYASGDDVFLVQRMRKAGRRIGASFDPQVTVTVEAERSWKGFLVQRLRWAGKMRGVRGTWPWASLLVTLLPWALLWGTLRLDVRDLLEVDGVEVMAFMLLGWLLWLVPAVNLVTAVQRTFGARTWPVVTTLCYLLFTLYSPVIAVASLIHRPRWKGRPT